MAKTKNEKRILLSERLKKEGIKMLQHLGKMQLAEQEEQRADRERSALSRKWIGVRLDAKTQRLFEALEHRASKNADMREKHLHKLVSSVEKIAGWRLDMAELSSTNC